MGRAQIPTPLAASQQPRAWDTASTGPPPIFFLALAHYGLPPPPFGCAVALSCLWRQIFDESGRGRKATVQAGAGPGAGHPRRGPARKTTHQGRNFFSMGSSDTRGKWEVKKEEQPASQLASYRCGCQFSPSPFFSTSCSPEDPFAAALFISLGGAGAPCCLSNLAPAAVATGGVRRTRGGGGGPNNLGPTPTRGAPSGCSFLALKIISLPALKTFVCARDGQGGPSPFATQSRHGVPRPLSVPSKGRKGSQSHRRAGRPKDEYNVAFAGQNTYFQLQKHKF